MEPFFPWNPYQSSTFHSISSTYFNGFFQFLLNSMNYDLNYDCGLILIQVDDNCMNLIMSFL